jgi:cytochrome P450
MDTWAKILVGIGGIILVLFVIEIYIEAEYKYLAAKHDCKLPATSLDRPFGISTFHQLRKANSNNLVLEYLKDSILDSGRMTSRVQTLFEVNIITVDPENIKAVLATCFSDYSLGIRHKQLYPLLGNGIFTLSGDGWKHSRAMLRPQFSRAQISQLDIINAHVQILVELFKTRSISGDFFDIQALFHNLTMDTATEFLFGESTDSLEDSHRTVQGPTRLVSAADFTYSFTYCLDKLSLRTHAQRFHWLVDSFEFRKRIDICHNFVDYFVIRALQKPMEKGQDSTKDRYVFIDELTKETRDPRVIRDQAFNVLLAGRDTTASLLSFIMFYLARDKDVWKKLRGVVLEQFGTGTDKITFESLKRCTYLYCVINEVLRLHPIVPLNFRTAIRDTILPRGGGPDESGSMFVKKGTKVVYNVYATQRHKSLWGEDADEFRPERWSEGKLHTWDYLPFNGGPRICLGQQFALTEAGFTVVRIVQSFKGIDYTGTSDYHRLPQWTKLTTSVANGVIVKFTFA